MPSGWPSSRVGRAPRSASRRARRARSRVARDPQLRADEQHALRIETVRAGERCASDTWKRCAIAVSESPGLTTYVRLDTRTTRCGRTGTLVLEHERGERSRADDAVGGEVDTALVTPQRLVGARCPGSRRAGRRTRRARVSRNCSTETSKPNSPGRMTRDAEERAAERPERLARALVGESRDGQVRRVAGQRGSRRPSAARRARRSARGRGRARAARPARPACWAFT